MCLVIQMNQNRVLALESTISFNPLFTKDVIKSIIIVDNAIEKPKEKYDALRK